MWIAESVWNVEEGRFVGSPAKHLVRVSTYHPRNILAVCLILPSLRSGLIHIVLY